ncbi:MAG: glycosyltransferase family 39 protein [Patescibacteria group bacterium]
MGKIPIWLWLLFFVGIALLQVFLVRNTVMGDAFIHFVFARGIAEGQPFFYNGEFSAGSTSPLWSALLAWPWKIFGENIIGFVKIFSSFFTALSVLLTFAVAREITKNKIIALATSFLVATSFVFSFWAAKGMETPFYVCLILGSFLFYLSIVNPPVSWGVNSQKSLPFEILLGILLGLAILTRPEAWFFAAILGIPLIVKKGWRVIFSVGLPAFLILSPYYFWLSENTGGILPSSAARILRAQQWAIEFHGIFFTPEIFKILFTKFLPLTPFVILFFYPFVNPPLKWWVNSKFVFLPIFAWLIFHGIFFTIIFPTTEGYRYLLAALPFFYFVAILGIWKLPKKFRIAALTFALVGSCIISGQQLFERMASIENCEIPFTDKTRRETGIWLRENSDSNDLIAMKEIDQSAFYSRRRMLSLDGTLDTKAIPFVKNGNQLEFLEREKPDFFILEEEMYREYPDWKDSNILPLLAANPEIGDSQALGGLEFTLREKLKSGDADSCAHFSDEYFWWIFEVQPVEISAD